MYLVKLFLAKLRARRDKLYRILLQLINDKQIRKQVAFQMWRNKVIALKCNESTVTIQKFLGDVQKKLLNRKNHKKLRRINEGLQILARLKYPKREAFNAIRSEANRKVFTKFNDDLANKRKDHLKTAYDAIHDAAIRNLLNRLFKIPDSARLRILRRRFNLWRDNANKLKKDEAAKKIQRKFRSGRNRNKRNNKKNLLGD